MSVVKVYWELFIARGVAPVRGTVIVDGDSSDEEISQIVEEEATDIIPSRISWRKGVGATISSGVFPATANTSPLGELIPQSWRGVR